MATASHGASAPTRSTDLRKLQTTIQDIDALSQLGFGEIAAIAKLALRALESPVAYRDTEMIAQALKAIWSKAEDIDNLINANAEEVGCNYIDPALTARCHARFEAQAKGVAA